MANAIEKSVNECLALIDRILKEVDAFLEMISPYDDLMNVKTFLRQQTAVACAGAKSSRMKVVEDKIEAALTRELESLKEDLHERFVRFVNDLKELHNDLPVTFKPSVKSRLDMVDSLEHDAEHLIRELLRKRGVIHKVVQEFSESHKVGEHKGDFYEGLCHLVVEAIDEELKDIVHDIVELRNALNHLRLVLGSIRNNPVGLKSKIASELSITLNCNMALLRNKGLRLENAVVLIDASFAHELFKRKRSKGKRFYNMTLNAKEILIPKQVFEEMEHRQIIHLWKPLIPAELRNYFRSVLGAKVVDIKPTPQQRMNVFGVWRSKAEKGKTASRSDQEKFKTSGDMSLLTYGLQHPRENVLILANDKDIGQVVEGMRKDLPKVCVAKLDLKKDTEVCDLYVVL